MAVANPVIAYTATLSAGGFVSHGQGLTVTVHLTNGWEIRIPIGVRYGTNVSLATAVYVFPMSTGLDVDTEPLVSFSIPTVASGRRVASIRLTTGQYVVVVQSSSPSTTFFVLTQEKITAYVVS